MPAQKKVDNVEKNKLLKIEARLNVLYNALKETREYISELNLTVNKIKDRLGL
jgi:hypothetical protein